MNKSELVETMAADANISKAAASAALDSFTATITGALAKGDSVTLVGFGTFMTNFKEGEKGKKNALTGGFYDTVDRSMPKFKPGTPLKEAVKEAFKHQK